jgi:hypothetical protein
MLVALSPRLYCLRLSRLLLARLGQLATLELLAARPRLARCFLAQAAIPVRAVARLQ